MEVDMKVLHISAQKPDSTGSGIYMSGIINGFRKKNIDQALIVGIDIADSEQAILEKFDGEVSLYPLKYNSEVLDFNVPGMSDNMPYPSTRYRDITSDQAAKMRDEFSKLLMDAVDKENPDVIICHHLYYISSITRELLPNKKIHAICHGTCIRQLMSNDFMRDYIIEKIGRLDGVFALHNEQKKTIEKLFGIDESKVKIIGSGYDSSIFNNKMVKKSGNIKISYAGKISCSKGLIPFINALNKIDISEDDIDIVFAGGASDCDELEEIVDLAKKSCHKIDFVGKIDQQELADLFNSSDIFVLPSYYEGLPLVILEALACGCYVICTNTDGLEEWLSDDIKRSGMFDLVELPEMLDIQTPVFEQVEGFENRLKDSLEKAVCYRKNNREKFLDISNLSWDGLSERLLILITENQLL